MVVMTVVIGAMPVVVAVMLKEVVKAWPEMRAGLEGLGLAPDCSARYR
jgi:hypothetical protein